MPGFVVDAQASGRSFHPFVDLPPLSGVEPEDWRPSTESGGRSLFLWSSKRRGFNLSMNRRPDGTFAGNLTASKALLDGLKSEGDVQELLRGAFAGVPEEWVPLIAEQVRPSPSEPGVDVRACACKSAVLLLAAEHCCN